MISISFSTGSFGFLSSAMVPSQISAKLKEQMLEAIPTAIPILGVTRTLGKVVGNRTGSLSVPS